VTRGALPGSPFFELVRRLERARPERDPVGGWGDPAREVARFVGQPGLATPPRDCAVVAAGADEPLRLQVAFMGLTGPLGVLPYHYTQLAGRGRRLGAALQAFLDLFHHRVVSLFYRAWAKQHPAAQHERAGRDLYTAHLADLVGLGTAGLQGRLPVPDEALLHYAGLLMLPSRPAAALEQLLADYFGVPVAVEQFVGGWQPLADETLCRLDDEATGVALGAGSVVGDEVWNQHARIRLRLGPLARLQYDAFLPSGAALAPLRALAHFFAGEECEVEVQPVLARDEIPACVLGEGPAAPLGWSTWLHTVPARRDGDEAVFTLESASAGGSSWA
jgi:type VI secretion system protein ImpH